MKRIKSVINNLIKIITKPEMAFLPANLAFFIVLSIFPILTLVGMVASYLSLSLDSFVSGLYSLLPNSIANLLVSYLASKSFTSNTIISAVLGFIMASNGTHALILASNSLYNIKNSNYIKRRIKALFLIMLLILLVVFLFAFLTFGNQLFMFILQIITYKPINNILYYLFAFIKWPFAMLIIYIIIKIVYSLAPDSRIDNKTTTKGALFTTILWTVSTAIFTFYISNFSNYDIFYGSISNIIVLMLWIYILSYILVIGIAINVEVFKFSNKEE